MKRLIVAAAALLLSVSAFAQFGVIGGLTSSSTSISSAFADFKTKKINQYHFGITYKFGGERLLAVQPSLIYNVKGANLNAVDGLGDLDIDMKTGFLELPIQVQAGANLGRIVRLYGIAEPFIGYAITNEAKYEGEKYSDWDYVKSRFEYGIGLGAGVELFSHFQVSVRYFWNLGSIYGTQYEFGKVTRTVIDSKCSGISLSAAVLF